MVEIGVDPRKTLCRECGPSARVVLDESMGDLVCTGCGLVQESHCIDMGVEWRSFAAEGVESGPRVNERERADKFDMMDEDSALQPTGTSFSGTDAASRSLMKAHRMASQNANSSMSAEGKHELKVKTMTNKIREVTSRLGLGEDIVRRCAGMIETLAKKEELNQRLQVPFFCALVHLASREEKATRTTAELAQANATAAGKKAKDLERVIDKRVKELRMLLDIPEPTAYARDEELMARFVNRLQLAPPVCKPAQHISRMAYKFGLVGKLPQTAIVASSIFIVAWLLNVEEKPSFTDVASIAKISEVPVRNAYKLLHGQIRRLLPDDFKSSLPGGLAGLPPPT